VFIPPPPGFKVKTVQDGGGGTSTKTDSGYGLGFFVKASLVIVGIYGVAHVVDGVARTARETRQLVRGG
jgi:hypothetical protein